MFLSKILELRANRLSALNSLTSRLPPRLQYLGLGSNYLGSHDDVCHLTGRHWLVHTHRKLLVFKEVNQVNEELKSCCLIVGFSTCDRFNTCTDLMAFQWWLISDQLIMTQWWQQLMLLPRKSFDPTLNHHTHWMWFQWEFKNFRCSKHFTYFPILSADIKVLYLS